MFQTFFYVSIVEFEQIVDFEQLIVSWGIIVTSWKSKRPGLDLEKLRIYLQAGICQNRLSTLALHINFDLGLRCRYVHLQPLVRHYILKT